MEYPVKIHDWNGRRLINARELHSYLESKQQFADWINARISKLGLIEDIHYWVFHKDMINSNGQGGRPQINYGLTIEAAELISIEERNEQGKKLRILLVEDRRRIRMLEQRLPKNEIEALEMLIVHKKQLILQEKQIRELKPKAEFTEKFLEVDSLFTISETAKALNIKGIGRNILYMHLRDWGILFKNRNEPKQEYVNRGYFRYVPYKAFELGDGTRASKSRTMATPKGIAFIAKKYGIISPPNLELQP